MSKKQCLEVDKLSFGEIQLRVLQSFKLDEDIKDKSEAFKKEHYRLFYEKKKKRLFMKSDGNRVL